ncbi:MAG: BatD family protein, partial [Sandaracinaceae bacterium]|nr:BatD family protein [Sandaracinaceae bacterium]
MLAVLVSSLAWGVPAAAQPVTGRVTLAVDRSSVSVGEVVRLEVRAEVVGDLNPRIQPPDATGFDVVGTQTSSQFSFGGGRPQATTTQYLSLLARSPGRFEIGPAHAIAAGRAFSSNVVTVEVAGAGGVVPPGPDPGQAEPGQVEPSQTGGEAMTFDPEGFVRTTADIAEPYVGQQVTVTVYLYLRANLQSPPAIRQEPTTDGFWTHSLVPTSRTLEVTQQVVRGAYFNVVVLRRFAAFPLRAGELTIGPTSISITPLGGIFAILGGGGGGPPLDRTGEPLAIRVRELPAAG